MEMFTRAAGIQLRRIPYKGVAPAIHASIEKAGMTVSSESRATFAASKYQKITKGAGIKEA